MTSEPLVSVLMTSYNREKYIAMAIEDVLASSFTDFELIIVDDRSADRTVEIAAAYREKDPRIRLYVNEQNLGDYNNRNKAASYARGKYLKYFDSDDRLYVHSLDVMVRAMEPFPEAALGFSFSGVQVDAAPFPIVYKPEEAYNNHFFKGGFFYQGPGGTMIRRDKFEAVGGFSGTRYIGDTELWMKLAQEYPVVLFHPSLIWWRRHEGQEFNAGHLSGEYDILGFQVSDRALRDKRCPLDSDSRQRAIRNNKNLAARKVWKHMFAGRFSRAAGLKKSCGLSAGDVLISLVPVNKINRMLGKSN